MFAYDIIALAAVTLATLLAFLHGRSTDSPPPCPPGIPVFGNLFQVDALRPHPQFLKWAQKYGSIFSLKLGPQRMVVLNTAAAADELLMNRSKVYSSRPSLHVAQDLVSDGQRMVFMPYDREWKVTRRNLQGVIGPGPSKRLREMQELESRVVLYDLICHGDQSITEVHVPGPNGEVPERHWFSVIRRYTTSVVMHLAYGKRVHRILNSPQMRKVYDVMSNFTRVAQPGAYLADTIRPLRWLPGILAPWRMKALKMHEWEMELWGGLLSECRASLKKGIYHSGFVPSYLRARAEVGCEDLPGTGVTPDGTGWMRDKLLAYTAGSLLEAGSDTTAATIQTFMLLMLHHPDALARAREELDRVVGVERMPGWDDEERLPWVIACIKETLRRRPPTIMGMPHRVDEDDVYEGYHIPKGSTVIGNIWAIHMDPVRYRNPAAFDPERFYDKDKMPKWASGPDSSHRDHYAFGWGRRFCQGSLMAEASLFIVLSRLIWGIDFYAPLDPRTDKPMLPDFGDEVQTWSGGFVSSPFIFPVGFRPRSEKHAEIMRTAFDDVQGEWQAMGLEEDER